MKKRVLLFLGAVDNSFSESLRPATCSPDSEILLNAQHYCTEIEKAGSADEPRDVETELSTRPNMLPGFVPQNRLHFTRDDASKRSMVAALIDNNPL